MKISTFVPYAAGAFVVIAAALAADTGNLSGRWSAVIAKLDDGTNQKVFIELEQNGTALTGRILFPWGTIPIKDGKVDGNHFEFSEVFDQGTRTVKVQGEKVGDELRYTSKNWEGKPEQRVATKAAPGEGQEETPARIEPPPLHKVKSNGLAKTPPMGWNSWNKFAGKVSDQVVREMADAMVTSGMKDAGYIYVNIDDTWEGRRDANGVLQPNHKFPDMKALADYVHSKGLKLGIYSSPGPKTCAGYQGSYGHEDIDAKTWASWGIDYLKYDWCSAGRIYKNSELQPVYQKMGDALLNSGRPIVFSLCEYGMGDVWKWGPDVGGNLWRTTGDISDNWRSMTNIGFNQGRLAEYAAPGHWNDPDMLEIGNGGMTDDEYRTHMTLWSILASPLLAGNDIRAMTPAIKSILLNKEVIAINQDPAGHQGNRLSAAGDQEIWTRPLHGAAVAVALFNRGNDAAQMTVKLADLKLSSAKKVRDLWAHQDVAFKDGAYSANVPKHGVVMLRVQP